MERQKLIHEDSERGIFRVHRSVFTAPAIVEQERQHIFDNCWLYLGHESEVAKPGDFRRRTVAGRPPFWVRGRDGKVRAFHNTCTHWGANVCRVDAGNADTFQCFYHAWTFDNCGELINVPDEAGYAPGFDKAELGLASPARLESYRGLYFVSFNPQVVEVASYLGGAKEYLDLILDQSEAGWEIVPGTQKYGVRANWKMFSLNSLDSYHVKPLHTTFFKYTQSLGPGEAQPPLPDFPGADGRSLALGNGHGVDLFAARDRARPIANWHPILGAETKEEIRAIRANLVKRFGEQRAYLMSNTNRLMLIYPNFALHDIAGISLRYFDPSGPDAMDVTVQTLAPKNESAALRRRRLENFVSFLGPGGFAHPDDLEAMESAQTGFRAGGPEWIDASRGMRRVATALDENHVRSFWRQWLADVNQNFPAAKTHVALGTDNSSR